MQDDAAMLQCPNDFCKAPNCQVDKFCKVCSTPLIKRYLWAVGDAIAAYQPGLIGDRYLLKSDRILLDTKPGLVAATPFAEISPEIKPYLRLVSYQLHIPQVYGWLLEAQTIPILLLEQAPIYTDDLPLAGQLMPELTKVWQEATPMRQLNWLWQIAQLWQPLSVENVASSLLAPQLIRVEGALIKLLQLQPDQTPPTLMELGLMWQQLVAASQPSITQFLEQLSDSLIQGEVQSPEELIALLDRGIAELGRSQARTLTISAYTDTGPSRQRNEDACYPVSGTTTTTDATQFNSSLVIVCDGIGGHEGGNIASNLAIETIQQQLLQIPPTDAFLDPITLSNYLENSTRVANDRISQRNDNEHRHGRQRMGTTLVMALARAHEIYITHVGDSRAYLITRTSCHQVTLDDDVASREVRLGYALYRDALQQPASGSLVQALGMSSSPSLHPTVQRFILDEDCIFLLCSDGLSDYDRVEQSWQEILPVLDGKLDVATATQRLVEIGNTQNGHDNVTVALVHCQVKFSEMQSLTPFAIDSPTSVTDSPTVSSWEDNDTIDPSIAAAKNTRLLPSEDSPQRHPIVPLLLGLILLVSIAGGLIGYLSRQRSPTTARYSPSNLQSPRSSASPVEPQINSTPVLKKGALIRTKSEIVLSQTKPPEVIPARQGQSVNFMQKVLPIGSILQVIDQQQISQQDYWLNLQVCSTPSIDRGVTTELSKNTGKSRNADSSPTTPTPIDTTNLPLLQPPDKGWIRAAEIKQHYLPVSSVEVNQKVNCPNLIKK
mgnify:CR=1 FL=1